MLRIWVLVLLISFWSIPCLAGEAENIQVVNAMIEAINDRDLDRLDALVATNVVRHSAATEGVPVTNLAAGCATGDRRRRGGARPGRAARR